jgi:hypothetical protein
MAIPMRYRLLLIGMVVAHVALMAAFVADTGALAQPAQGLVARSAPLRNGPARPSPQMTLPTHATHSRTMP